MSGIKNKIWFKAIISLAASAIVTLIMLLILAGIVTIAGSELLVKIFNVLIRLAAAGVCAFILSDGKRALVKGLLAGVVSYLGVFLVFVAFGGMPSVVSALINLAFTLVFALIFSVIFVNFKKNV